MENIFYIVSDFGKSLDRPIHQIENYFLMMKEVDVFYHELIKHLRNWNVVHFSMNSIPEVPLYFYLEFCMGANTGFFLEVDVSVEDTNVLFDGIISYKHSLLHEDDAKTYEFNRMTTKDIPKILMEVGL